MCNPQHKAAGYQKGYNYNMLIEKIIHRKYGLNGNNNPTDFFVGMTHKIRPRETGKSRIYFVDIPEHGNMGDQAIAHAMIQYAAKFSDKYELVSFPISHLLESLWSIKRDCRKGDVFFLIGGGNMGIEYFPNEEVRRIIIEMFPKNRIIIFPQTIDYGSSEKGKQELKNAIQIYGKHRDLHIFARELESYHRMQDYFKINNVYLTPDIVYSLHNKKNEKWHYIVNCIRKDRESKLKPEDHKKIEQLLEDCGKVKKVDTVEAAVPIISSENIREILIYRKLDVFAGAKFVVTDRLHGMIFSVITHTPCFVFPSYNHKLISSYQTWLKDNPYVVFLQNVDDLKDRISEFRFDDNADDFHLQALRKEFRVLDSLL